jgi:exonuclease SbcC
MRFEHLRFKGIGPFPDEVAVDLAAVPGRLIAIQGSNGAGKSTMLELLVGGLTRTTPTRGSLVDLATARDAFVETRVVNGATHTLRHTLDATSRKSEALVLDEHGAPELPSTSVKAYDAWAKSHLPAPEVLLASTFAAQGSGGFLDMSAGDRKQVLARTLGIEHLERLAQEARDRARGAKARLDVAVAKLGELGAAVDLKDAEDAEREARAAAKEADAELTRRREQVAAAALYRETDDELRAASVAIADLQTRIRNNEDLLENAEQIRAAGPRIEAIRAELAAIAAERSAGEARRNAARARSESAADRELAARVRVAQLEARARTARDRAAGRAGVKKAICDLIGARTDLAADEETLAAMRVGAADTTAVADGRAKASGLEEQARAADATAARAAARAREITARADLARTKLRDRHQVEAAVAALPGERAALAALEGELAQHQAVLAAANDAQLGGAGRRIGELRGALEEIAEDKAPGGLLFEDVARDALRADDEALVEQAGAPARAEAARKAIADATKAIATAREQLAAVERIAGRASEIAAADLEIERCERDLAAARAEEDAARAQGTAARRNAAAAREAIAAAEIQLSAARDRVRAGEQAVASARSRIAELERIAGRLGEIEAAERELAAIETDRAAAAAEEERAGAEAAAAARDAGAEGVALDALPPREEALRAELPALQVLAGRLAKLVAAEGVLVERREQLAAAEAKAADARSRLAELPEPVDADVDAAERAARDAHVAAANATAALDRARATEARRAELEAERAAAVEEASDYERLGQDLGANGVQADLMDAAAPALTEMTNNLLHEAFGSRFSVRFDSTRSSADGKKQIETLDVTVLDTEAGREGKAETFSGGERVILSEAISLALTMLACQRSGFERPDLIRDESGAALDEENGRRYVAMLRRAADLLDASHVFLVSHSEDVRALCDARIEVADGRVEVRS